MHATLTLARPVADHPEIAPQWAPARRWSSARRVLVAGIGDPFRGDDAFGFEVSRRLSQRPLPPWVEVVDFASRGLDLVFALQQGYEAAVLIDTVRRGEAPGTLTVIEPDVERGGEVALDPAALDAVGIVRFARLFGPLPGQVRVVSCEPAELPPPGLDPAARPHMSSPVAEAVRLAVPLVESLIADLQASRPEVSSAADGLRS
ncbi:MAG TPA: hydrogenase maturation protease [Thermoanaerobaculia bacterium]|nr:hydrogenase maturation protease [Thermoanaerobaculia bacterium]